MTGTGINQAAVDRLVARAAEAVPGARVSSAFSGTRGLAPTMVAVVAAIPASVVVAISLVLDRPLLLLVAVAVMAATMAVVMTKVNATRVVAELPRQLVVLSATGGALHEVGRVDKALRVEPGTSRSWLRVEVGDELLWVSRPAFGGIVERFTDPSPDPAN